MLTDAKIEKEAAMASSYIKGYEYYRKDRVENLRYFPRINSFKAMVHGGEKYLVYIDFNEDNEVVGYECNCLAFAKYDGACKHIVAVMKAIQKNWRTFFGQEEAEQADPSLEEAFMLVSSKTGEAEINLSPAVKELLAFFNHELMGPREEEVQAKIRLIPTYGISIIAGTIISYLEFSIGIERMYVLKDIPQMLNAWNANREIVYGKYFTLKPNEQAFDEASQGLLGLLQTAYADEKQLANGIDHASPISAFTDPRYLRLSKSNLLKFLELMGDNSFPMIINHERVPEVRVVKGRPPVSLLVKAANDGIQVKMEQADKKFYSLDADFTYIYHDQMIYCVEEKFSKYIKPLLKCFNETNQFELYIPNTAISEFFSIVLPAVEKIGIVHIDETLLNNFYKQPLEKQVYFDKLGKGISVRVEFKYGELVINPAEGLILLPDLKDKVLVRAAAEEKQLMGLFYKYGFKIQKGMLVQQDEEAIYRFLQEGMPEIRNIAEVFYSNEFKNVKINYTARVSAGIRINTQDMLELSLHYEELEAKELFELLSSYKMKKRYHRLKDGAFIPLDSAELQTVADLIDQLNLDAEDLEKKVIELPKYRAMYIDSLTREASDFHIERSSMFKKMVQDIYEPQDMEFELPNGIQGKLRDYQKTGFKWLKSLASYGFGGILADDMGLGKTLQVITFVLSEKEGKELPTLVVAPTSLVYNWQDEVKKFAPSLKVTVVSGQPEERLEQMKNIDATDLVVTSYALIKRDIEYYQGKIFKYCFLDEAQHIKNPKTLTAKSVKKIKAGGYFALTGTPIENTLTELWSIFDFLIPGYLGNHQSFTNRFEIPIMKDNDEKALTELGRHIKPFILRRMKKAVLKELPEKIESRMINEMTSEQAKIYAAWLMKAKQELENEIHANGFQKNQIKILALLTRLRQICCHPGLVFENYHGGSGKLEILKELLQEAVSGGHRILLFSQFTSMLELIKKELAKGKIQYYYLDGSTKAEDRIRLVNSFNAGEKNVFLISLKAGGTGLNLTGADMVIHYDPWWNPAVEDQATDRAYRIGQKNSVQVYKLITKNTIEEKIYELQQRKKEMIDALIKPGENLLTKMSEEEIRELFDFSSHA